MEPNEFEAQEKAGSERRDFMIKALAEEKQETEKKLSIPTEILDGARDSLASGDLLKAMQAIEKINDENLNHETMLSAARLSVDISRRLGTMGETERARQFRQKGISYYRRLPVTNSVNLELADLYEQDGDPDKAALLLGSIINNDDSISTRLIRLYGAIGRFEKLKSYYYAMLAGKPLGEKILEELIAVTGSFPANIGEIVDWILPMAGTQERKPDLELTARLIEIITRVKFMEQAALFVKLTSAFTTEDSSAAHLWAQAEAAFSASKLEESLFLIEKAIAISSEPRMTQRLLFMLRRAGVSHYAAGRNEQALGCFTRACELGAHQKMDEISCQIVRGQQAKEANHDGN